MTSSVPSSHRSSRRSKAAKVQARPQASADASGQGGWPDRGGRRGAAAWRLATGRCQPGGANTEHLDPELARLLRHESGDAAVEPQVPTPVRYRARRRRSGMRARPWHRASSNGSARSCRDMHPAGGRTARVLAFGGAQRRLEHGREPIVPGKVLSYLHDELFAR